MRVSPTRLAEVKLIEPVILADERGLFFESFNEGAFNTAMGLDVHFVQDNHSRSSRGVLRGLHYQLPPQAQGKLVRVTSGCVFDVAVDVRAGSPTLGQWVGVELDAVRHRQLWIPPGFAHGFLVLSDSADFLYKTTAPYSSADERAIRWDDDVLGIQWPLGGLVPKVSGKDAVAPLWPAAALFPQGARNA